MQVPPAVGPTVACVTIPTGVPLPARGSHSWTHGQQSVLTAAVAFGPSTAFPSQQKAFKAASQMGSSSYKKGPTDQDFINLLGSLEDRIDLMSQIEHTRLQLETRSSELEDSTSSGDQISSVISPESTIHAPSSCGDCRRCLEQQEQINDLTNELQQVRYELLHERAAVSKYRFESAALLEASGSADARLAHENKAIREQLRLQRDHIERLTEEMESLRSHPPGDDAHSRIIRNRRLTALDSDSKHAGHNTLDVTSRSVGLCKDRTNLGNTPSLGTLLVPSSSSAADLSFITAPFSRQAMGSNITVSADGYTAKRTRGCRQSIALGSIALAQQALGWYYEVVIRETVEGWVGGLGIGVTCSSPNQLQRVPDKAWQISGTYIIGYWGCVWLDGKESMTAWHTDTLRVGSRVGVLVANDGSGDLRVFVDGSVVACVSGALLDCIVPGIELFPIVDIFASTLAVTLQQCASPPRPSWVE